ncbi:MAG: hypothetical protein RJB62_878 [Pseudomonadota bacterium]|jgi:hypothetical protein
MSESLDEAAVIAAIEAETIEQYLARGRSHSALTDMMVSDIWVAAFCAWIRAQDIDSSIAEEDARGELLLRGLPLPDERVRAEITAMADKLAN